MLHRSNLSLSYWSYAFSTTIYLINRVPSSVLNFISPLEKLYDHKPPFHSLKTFGCACYPFLKPYNSHKFDPKSLDNASSLVILHNPRVISAWMFSQAEFIFHVIVCLMNLYIPSIVFLILSNLF